MDSLQLRGVVTTTAFLLALSLAMAGCDDSSVDSTASGGQSTDGSVLAVQGIATPSSVSVVTAKNAD